MLKYEWPQAVCLCCRPSFLLSERLIDQSTLNATHFVRCVYPSACRFLPVDILDSLFNRFPHRTWLCILLGVYLPRSQLPAPKSTQQTTPTPKPLQGDTQTWCSARRRHYSSSASLCLAWRICSEIPDETTALSYEAFMSSPTDIVNKLPNWEAPDCLH